MAEVWKSFTAQKQVNNALDLGDENRKKIKKTSNVWYTLLY